jgi:transketolase
MVMNLTSPRDIFWHEVFLRAQEDPDIILMTADMGAPMLDMFREQIPEQFINIGIAEQNAILVASGLALQGKRVYVYAIEPFLTLRCLEQIKLELAVQQFPIQLVGVGAGLAYDDSGPTHNALEDLAIIRALPGIDVVTLSDNTMTAWFGQNSTRTVTPTLYRIDRFSEKIYPDKTEFSSGYKILHPGENMLIANGIMVHKALQLRETLASKGYTIGVCDAYKLPFTDTKLCDELKSVKRIITLEEHFLAGGLGSAVLELLSDNEILNPLKRFGLDPKKGYCHLNGGREQIHNYYGLSSEQIEPAITDFITKQIK